MNTFIDPHHARTLDACRPLPAWTYTHPELTELEYERAILPAWQFVCHVNQVPAAGDYATLDLWRDSVLVIRGEDGVLRGFQNACRHRGAKLIDGSGNCPRLLTCPYHAWSYRHDGSLAAVPVERSFRALDKPSLGLRPVEIETFCGLVFARIVPGGPALAELLADLAVELAPYRIEEMVPAPQANVSELWDCNWKVALDNYLDNYHVPFGHPGLHRLMDCQLGCTINAHGVSFSHSRMRTRASAVWSERLYQRLAPVAFAMLPEHIRTRWMFCFMPVNIGIDVFPDSIDIFQVLPRGAARTEIRLPLLVRPDVRREARAVRYLADRINRQVGREDRSLCERVQAGIGSHRYTPGPFSDFEMPVRDVHQRLRELCPVMALDQPPPAGELRRRNRALPTDRVGAGARASCAPSQARGSATTPVASSVSIAAAP
jgi:phenylpropionate dioxygenase-like ring-hydroxylating dioxygenase large terminal subunit